MTTEISVIIQKELPLLAWLIRRVYSKIVIKATLAGPEASINIFKLGLAAIALANRFLRCLLPLPSPIHVHRLREVHDALWVALALALVRLITFRPNVGVF